MNTLDVLHCAPDDLQPRRFREAFELIERILNAKFVLKSRVFCGARSFQFRTDEKRAFSGRRGWEGDWFWDRGLLIRFSQSQNAVSSLHWGLVVWIPHQDFFVV